MREDLQQHRLCWKEETEEEQCSSHKQNLSRKSCSKAAQDLSKTSFAAMVWCNNENLVKWDKIVWGTSTLPGTWSVPRERRCPSICHHTSFSTPGPHLRGFFFLTNTLWNTHTQNFLDVVSGAKLVLKHCISAYLIQLRGEFYNEIENKLFLRLGEGNLLCQVSFPNERSLKVIGHELEVTYLCSYIVFKA